MTATETMTAEQFLALPYSDETRFKELVDGEVVVTQANMLHGELQTRLLIALRGWSAAPRGRGSAHLPLDVVLDERNVYAPDVSWYAKAHDLRAEGPYPVPHIAAEVRSPSTWRYDIGAKKAGYERSGLRELWLVDTAAEVVLVFRRSHPEATGFDDSAELAAGETLTSPQLEDFELDVGELFSL